MTERKTAEWGMLTMQASFLQVKDQFIYKEQGEQQIVLKMFVLLYNMRTRMVGINQIKNTYMQYLHLWLAYAVYHTFHIGIQNAVWIHYHCCK